MEHGVEHNRDVLLLSAAQFQSLQMERFRVIGMNWAPHYAFPVILVTTWFQRVLHLEPVFLMAKEEENGPKWILSVNW